MTSILIIEDDEQTVALMLNVFRNLEHKIFHAPTAHHGLALAQEHLPSLILLDMRLPGMNGWELAPIIKSDPQLREIPLVAVSVPTGADDTDMALNAGCDDYIPKPFNIKDLRACVNHYLGN